MVIGRRESKRPNSRAERRGSIESLSIQDKLDKVAPIGPIEAIQAGPFGDSRIRSTCARASISTGHLSTRQIGATRPPGSLHRDSPRIREAKSRVLISPGPPPRLAVCELTVGVRDPAGGARDFAGSWRIGPSGSEPEPARRGAIRAGFLVCLCGPIGRFGLAWRSPPRFSGRKFASGTRESGPNQIGSSDLSKSETDSTARPLSSNRIHRRIGM